MRRNDADLASVSTLQYTVISELNKNNREKTLKYLFFVLFFIGVRNKQLIEEAFLYYTMCIETYGRKFVAWNVVLGSEIVATLKKFLRLLLKEKRAIIACEQTFLVYNVLENSI